MIKVLNLYSGIGGNRKLWKDVEVTAIEINPEIAKIYKDFFPNDQVLIADAHKYLLEYYKEFDFIWSSPPCPTHSRLTQCYGNNKVCNKLRYPDMKLYEEILLLKHFFKGKYVVENVISYYNPLIRPYKFREHYYWSNFIISGRDTDYRGHTLDIKGLEKLKGFNLNNYNNIDKIKILRNCVEPEAGLYIFNCAFKTIQKRLR